jgi:hypothetical protein
MSTRVSLVIIAPFLLLVRASAAAEPTHSPIENLAIGLRSFPDKVVYGDPLFIELNIENRGTETIRVPLACDGNVEFQATDEEFSVTIDCSSVRVGAADVDFELADYEPGEKRKFLFQVFLPKPHQLAHPFWRGIENRGGVRVYCRFLIGRVALKSNLAWATITARDQQELHDLERWSRLDTRRQKVGDSKIFPFTVGIVGLLDVRTKEDMKEIATAVNSGELGGLLNLAVRLQELESDANKEPGSQALLAWVKEQPDIKRQWLANRLQKLDWLVPPPVLQSLEKLAK